MVSAVALNGLLTNHVSTASWLSMLGKERSYAAKLIVLWCCRLNCSAMLWKRAAEDAFPVIATA